MKLHRVMSVALACASPLLLGACGGDSDDVTGSSPRYPSVSGDWEGVWYRPELPVVTRHEVKLSLSQSQDKIWGTLALGRYYVNEVTGTVSESGVLEFTGQDTDGVNACVAYASERPHLGLGHQGSTLEGPVVAASCSSGQDARYTGVMELDRMH